MQQIGRDLLESHGNVWKSVLLPPHEEHRHPDSLPAARQRTKQRETDASLANIHDGDSGQAGSPAGTSDP